MHRCKLNQGTKFIADSGATNHFFCDTKHTFDFKPSNQKIYTASNQSHKILGIGKATLKLGKYYHLTLSEVVVCDELTANFISIPKLVQFGFRSAFDDNSVKIYKDKILVLDG